jgi:hypothetical protein
MAISEEARHALYNRLRAVLGDREAATLMEHLPPIGWADVATKHDVDAAVTLLRAEMQSLEHRLDASLHRELGRQFRAFVFANLGLMATLVSLTYAATRMG